MAAAPTHLRPDRYPNRFRDRSDTEGMFRETLWFKRGELDEEATPLPIEDRYLDDGQVSSMDSFEWGVHTGETRRLPPEVLRACKVERVTTSVRAPAVRNAATPARKRSNAGTPRNSSCVLAVPPSRLR